MHSLHLTRCRVSYELAARWRDTDQQPGFRDSYAWHRRAWDLFPGRPEDQRDFLTRLDLKGEGFQLLLLSKQAPVRPPWCTGHEGDWETKHITPDFFQHSAYTFSLVANPTRSVREAHTGEKRGRGSRQAVTKREDLVAWMQRKAQSGGFSVDESTLRTSARPRDQFVKQGKSGFHHAVEFSGTLRITDPTTFLTTFQNGIGSAKAFGFGMLCIAPLKNSN